MALGLVIGILDVSHAMFVGVVNEVLLGGTALGRGLLGSVQVVTFVGHWSHLLR